MLEKEKIKAKRSIQIERLCYIYSKSRKTKSLKKNRLVEALYILLDDDIMLLSL